MLRTVNRVLLALLGLVLLALGLAVLAGGLDLVGAAWPWSGPEDVLLSDADRTRWRSEGWWWPVVIAALAVLALLTLWWLVAQLRRQRLREVLVDSGDGEGALLRARALEQALASQAQELPGVDRARVGLRGRRRTTPRVRARLLLEPHAEPARTVERLRLQALEHARTSAGLAELPAEVRLRAVRHRPERVT